MKIDMYTLLHLKWITNKDLSTAHWELCSMLCGSLDGRGVWGRVDTGIYMAESLGSCHTIVNWLCSNIKLKVKKKNGGIAQSLVTITFTKRSNRLGWIIESGLRCVLLNTLFLLKHQT